MSSPGAGRHLLSCAVETHINPLLPVRTGGGMIIGVAGTNAAGKSTIVRMLEERGFLTLSLSDVIREEASRRGLPHDRAVLQQLANEMRERDGPAALMREALRRIRRPDLPVVIDSIRNPAEVEALRERDALLIGVDAQARVRFARAIERAARTGRVENAPTFEDFLAREAIENSENPNGQQLDRVLGMADVVFRNDQDEEELKRRVTRVFSRMPETDARKLPWPTYFMRIAHLVSRRSSCLTRHIGAVIVRDNKLLCSGYNGTPAGVPNCDMGGCPRCADTTVPSGTRLDECLCVHAEQNAIFQAAKHGFDIGGAEIYVTNFPCVTCAKAIVSVGIVRVWFDRSYSQNELAMRVFQLAHIEVTQVRE